MIGQPSLHRWRNPQRLVHPTEIIIHKPECDRSRMVFHLLGEGICEARKSPNAHSHGKILPLNKRCGQVQG
jgi:hypothetical protein